MEYVSRCGPGPWVSASFETFLLSLAGGYVLTFVLRGISRVNSFGFAVFVFPNMRLYMLCKRARAAFVWVLTPPSSVFLPAFVRARCVPAHGVL
jgi:hypothetical protein